MPDPQLPGRSRWRIHLSRSRGIGPNEMLFVDAAPRGKDRKSLVTPCRYPPDGLHPPPPATVIENPFVADCPEEVRAVTVPVRCVPAGSAGSPADHAPEPDPCMVSETVPPGVRTLALTEAMSEPSTVATSWAAWSHTGGSGLLRTPVIESDSAWTITGISTRLPSSPTRVIVPEAATSGSVMVSVTVTGESGVAVPPVGDALIPSGTPVIVKATPAGFAEWTVKVAVVWPGANVTPGSAERSGPGRVVVVVVVVVVIGVVVVTNNNVVVDPKMRVVPGAVVVDPCRS